MPNRFTGGHIKVNTQIAAWAQIEEENSVLEPGGLYRPTDCIPRNRVAIVIPFRDRDIHLKIFMRNIHPFLQSQQLDYGIFVIEMVSLYRSNIKKQALIRQRSSINCISV